MHEMRGGRYGSGTAAGGQISLGAAKSRTADSLVGKNLRSPNWANKPKRLSLSFTGSFNSAKQSSIPLDFNASFNSTKASADVTSTLVIGSAATTTRFTGVGEAATASSTRWLNNSALAKNKGASQRNRTKPSIRRAEG